MESSNVVVPLRQRVDAERERELRRLALQIVGQLPASTPEAMVVLELATGLVQTFFGAPV